MTLSKGINASKRKHDMDDTVIVELNSKRNRKVKGEAKVFSERR